MVEENGTGIHIYQVKGEQALNIDSHIGTKVNLYSTSLGKAYLAYLPEERRNELVGKLDPEAEPTRR
jgi:DNA-binding IclR family transcriptional regulator